MMHEYLSITIIQWCIYKDLKIVYTISSCVHCSTTRSCAQKLCESVRSLAVSESESVGPLAVSENAYNS